MTDGIYTVQDAIAAETAAAEAALAAEKLLSVGAWFAYAAATELAKTRRAKADRIKARIAQHLVAA